MGFIASPLAGRFRPLVGSDGGRGLLIANQLGDLVEIRSGPWGSNVRLYTSIGEAGEAGEPTAR